MIHRSIYIYIYICIDRQIRRLVKKMHDYKSLQSDDEDTSKYFINYINDETEAEFESSSNNDIDSPAHNNDEIDVSKLPNDLIITPVSQELFADQQLKVNEYKRKYFIFDICSILE